MDDIQIENSKTDDQQVTIDNKLDDGHETDYVAATRKSSLSVDIGTNKLLINDDVSSDIDTVTIRHGLSGDKLSISIYLLFVLVGIGPSWLLLDSMFIQVPYFQRYQPEGITIANKMTISGMMPLVTIIPLYFIVVNNYSINKISFRKLIYFFIILQITSCILIACFWSLTIGNVSIIIHLVTFISSFIGHMQLIVVIPWMTSINNKLSPPLFTGTNIGTLMTAIFGLIQQPGSDSPLFTPTVFYLIWLIPLICALICYIYIDYKHLKTISKKMKKYTAMDYEIDMLKRKKIRARKNSLSKVITILNITFAVPIWWRKIWKFALLNAYIQLVAWVFVRSSIPYAVSHTSTDIDGNTQTEQYAIELSYLAVLLGSVLSMFLDIKNNKYFWYLTIFYTIVTIVFLIIAIDASTLWIFWGSNGFVVGLVFIIRFVDGYMSPLIYKNIADLYPNKSHKMNQWISATAAIVAFVGVWITYVLVKYHVF